MRHAKGLLHVSLWLALAACGAVSVPAAAETAADWTPVDEAQLDQLRGGFSLPGMPGLPAGLQVSLGIERLVSINGDVVAHTRLDIPNLNALNNEQRQQTQEALSSVKLVQNGSDNIYRPGDTSGTVAGIVVQNTLNDQSIQSQTVISSTVNSASLLKTLNFQSSLSDALTRAVGGR